jgi:VanZ family protein
MRKHDLVRYWLPLGVYGLLIFIQSMRPLMIPALRHLDKPLHFVAYAILGILVFRALRSLPGSFGTVMTILAAVFVSAIVGCGDELIQIFVPSRTLDRADFLFDVLGSFSGIVVYQAVVVLVRMKTGQGNADS